VRNNIVPEVSYSSSDDEEFYYDAPEEANITYSANEVTDDSGSMSLNTNNNFTEDYSIVDYDCVYDDDEEELGSIESHGSVISHLISQVKIGMDLTKVVLPTFILERRSLLEMYKFHFYFIALINL
jgi:oxysterol-binding protein-related protein 9/10/11